MLGVLSEVPLLATVPRVEVFLETAGRQTIKHVGTVAGTGAIVATATLSSMPVPAASIATPRVAPQTMVTGTVERQLGGQLRQWSSAPIAPEGPTTVAGTDGGSTGEGVDSAGVGVTSAPKSTAEGVTSLAGSTAEGVALAVRSTADGAASAAEGVTSAAEGVASAAEGVASAVGSTTEESAAAAGSTAEGVQNPADPYADSASTKVPDLP